MTIVGTWNLHLASAKTARRLGDLLTHVGEPPRVVMLQEANPTTLDAFCDSAGLSWWVAVETEFPDLLAVVGRDGRGKARRPRGVAMAGTGTPARAPTPFPDLPLAEKALAAWIDVGDCVVTVVTYHAPAGVQHQQRKPEQAVRLARWLSSVEGPLLLGGDFNTPEIDHPDHALIRTHWHTGHPDLRGSPGDDLLVGPNEIHPLRDVLRTWLDDHPTDADALKVAAPTGPLAVSHRTGAPRNPRRYDAIWASAHFAVNAVDYRYEAALDAGSDHALVTADLTLIRPDG